MSTKQELLDKIKKILVDELAQADFEEEPDGEWICHDSNRGFDVTGIMKQIAEVLR